MNGLSIRRRKGITPVIAVVLLLLMTVASAGMAFVFITQIQTQAQTQAGELLTTQQKAALAAISITTVYNDTAPPCTRAAPGCVVLSIKNTGSFSYTQSEFLQSSVVVNGRPVAGNLLATTAPELADGLAPGEITNQPIDVAWPVAIGSTLTIRVTPPFGQEAAYQCILRTAGADFC